jgi:hypothetical protein
VRRRQGDEETWTPVYAALNLPLINEFSRQNDWDWRDGIPEAIDSYLTLAGLPQRSLPIATELCCGLDPSPTPTNPPLRTAATRHTEINR